MTQPPPRYLFPLLSVLLFSTQPVVRAADSILPENNSTLNTTSIGDVLPADSAFAFSALIEAPNTIVLLWDIRDGYYLYRKSLSFTETGTNVTAEAVIPNGELTSDEFFGDVEVYYERLLVRIPFERTDFDPGGGTIELELSYQGCAEGRYCYPMQHKSVTLEIFDPPESLF